MKYTRRIFSLTLMSMISIAGFSQPNLNSPSTTTDLDAAFTIQLSYTGGATSYDIELSNDGSFTGSFPDYQAQIAGGRTFKVDSLNYGGTYQLRWSADNTGQGFETVTIKSSPTTWAKITNGETFGDSKNITPRKDDLVSTYDWQFDTVATFDSPALVQATTDADVSSGIYNYQVANFITNEEYFVRVRGNVAYQGLTGDWGEVRNFFTSSSPTPILQQPSLGATDLEPNFLISISTVNGASTYDIELSNDGSFTGSAPDYQAQIANTKRNFTVTALNYGGSYELRWRTNASTYATTTVSVKDNPITYANITNGKVYTADGTMNPESQLYVTSYDWEFDTTQTWDSPLLMTTSTDASVNSGRVNVNIDDFEGGVTYYVRVRANVASQGLTGPWSTDVRNFSFALKSAPTLTSPSDGSTVSTTFTARIGAVSDATSYEMELSVDSTFTGSHPDYQTSNLRRLTASDLTPGETYHLRFRANNSEYGTATFTVDSETFADITDGTYLDFQSGTIPVSPVVGATGYVWEFDTQSSFGTSNLMTGSSDPAINDGAYSLDANDFQSGRLYYVRVRETSGSFGSTVRSFYAPLHLVDVTSPAVAVLNRNTFKLECDVTNNATTYEFELADNAGFANSTIYVSNRDFYDPGGWTPDGEIVTKVYDYVSGASPNTDYYVRARAYNDNQASEFGPSITFNTGLISPPTLNTPGLDATDQSPKLSVAALSQSGATTYNYEISHDGSFTGTYPDYQSSMSSTRIITFDGLTYGHTYTLRWSTDISTEATTSVTIKSSPTTFADINNGITFGATRNITPKFDQSVTSFDWEFDTSPTFDSPNLITASTDYATDLGRYAYDEDNFITGSTQYYVRVRGIVSSQSLTGDWGEVRNFFTSSGTRFGASNDLGSDEAITIYPNPSSSAFNIVAPSDGSITVSDLTGSVVIEKDIEAGVVSFGSDLNPGLYIVVVETASGTEIQRIIKE